MGFAAMSAGRAPEERHVIGRSYADPPRPTRFDAAPTELLGRSMTRLL